MRKVRIGDKVIMDWPKHFAGKTAEVTSLDWGHDPRTRRWGPLFRLRIGAITHTRAGNFIRYGPGCFHYVNANGVANFGDWFKKVAEK